MSFFNCSYFSVTFAALSDWQMVSGPTVKIQAIIKPYINISINSPSSIKSNLPSDGPAVVFDCNQGPGTYLALYPLTFDVISNTPFQLQFEAIPLVEQITKAEISPEKIAVRFNDPTKTSNVFTSFKKGEKKVIFRSEDGGVTFTTECDFQLDITYEDIAGIYEGAIFVEVLYQPTS